MAGKGDTPRPFSVPLKDFDNSYESIFGKKPPKVPYVYVPPEHAVEPEKKDKQIIALIAHLVEQRTCNAQVVSSNPTEGTKFQDRDSNPLAANTRITVQGNLGELVCFVKFEI